MSFLLKIDSTGIDFLNDTSDNFTIYYDPPIILEAGWYVGLIKANLWYSYYNISAELGNNIIRYYNGTLYRPNIVIPDGNYTISQLNNFLHSVMKDNGDFTLVGSEEVYDIELIANLSTIRVDIELTNNYTIDLSLSDIYLLLGFDQIEVVTSSSAPYIANINRDINSLEIHCSLINSTYSNSFKSDVMYTFVPTSVPGTNIDVDPITKIYVPVRTDHNAISQITMKITDNLQRRVNFNDQPVTYLLHFKKML